MDEERALITGKEQELLDYTSSYETKTRTEENLTCGLKTEAAAFTLK